MILPKEDTIKVYKVNDHPPFYNAADAVHACICGIPDGDKHASWLLVHWVNILKALRWYEQARDKVIEDAAPRGMPIDKTDDWERRQDEKRQK